MGGQCHQSVHLCGQQSNISHRLLQIVCGHEILGRTVESDAKQKFFAQQRLTRRWLKRWQLQWKNSSTGRCVKRHDSIIKRNSMRSENYENRILSIFSIILRGSEMKCRIDETGLPIKFINWRSPRDHEFILNVILSIIIQLVLSIEWYHIIITCILHVKRALFISSVLFFCFPSKYSVLRLNQTILNLR